MFKKYDLLLSIALCDVFISMSYISQPFSPNIFKHLIFGIKTHSKFQIILDFLNQ